MTRRRAQFLGILALVIGLHVTIGWLFFATTHLLSIPRSLSQTLQIVFIVPQVARPEPGAARAPLETQRGRRTHSPPAISSQSVATTPSAAPEADAAHALIDWTGELSRAASNAVPTVPAPAPKDFGFPRASTPPKPKTGEFGWDYAHTHRVESIDGGGLLIHLNDNCVLVLFPLPFAGCAMGKRKANGDLFKHMRDPSASGDAHDTP